MLVVYWSWGQLEFWICIRKNEHSVHQNFISYAWEIKSPLSKGSNDQVNILDMHNCCSGVLQYSEGSKKIYYASYTS